MKLKINKLTDETYIGLMRNQIDHILCECNDCGSIHGISETKIENLNGFDLVHCNQCNKSRLNLHFIDRDLRDKLIKQFFSYRNLFSKALTRQEAA